VKYTTPVAWHPAYDEDQLVYFGSYNGSPYMNLRGYFSDIVSGTNVNDKWLAYLAYYDIDNAYTGTGYVTAFDVFDY